MDQNVRLPLRRKHRTQMDAGTGGPYDAVRTGVAAIQDVTLSEQRLQLVDSRVDGFPAGSSSATRRGQTGELFVGPLELRADVCR